MRKRDGKVLAIERTTVQPFVKEKEDFAAFEGFLDNESDQTLAVHGLWIQVLYRWATLRRRPAAARAAIIRSVHEWIKLNRLVLAAGTKRHHCTDTRAPGEPDSEIILTTKVTALLRASYLESGVVHVRRKQVDSTLGDVIETALKKRFLSW